MTQQIVELTCPGCGARVTTEQKVCKWCHQPIVISSFSTIGSMPMPRINKYVRSYKEALDTSPHDSDLNKSIGLCYLKLKLYDKALSSFERAMEENFDDSEPYFYAAVCSLGGKKAFMNLRPAIDQCLEYINAALSIEQRGIYYYLLAYVKYDYFFRKHFLTSPDYQECLQMAHSVGVSDFDIDQVYAMLGVARPAAL